MSLVPSCTHHPTYHWEPIRQSNHCRRRAVPSGWWNCSSSIVWESSWRFEHCPQLPVLVHESDCTSTAGSLIDLWFPSRSILWNSIYSYSGVCWSSCGSCFIFSYSAIALILAWTRSMNIWTGHSRTWRGHWLCLFSLAVDSIRSLSFQSLAIIRTVCSAPCYLPWSLQSPQSTILFFWVSSGRDLIDLHRDHLGHDLVERIAEKHVHSMFCSHLWTLGWSCLWQSSYLSEGSNWRSSDSVTSGWVSCSFPGSNLSSTHPSCWRCLPAELALRDPGQSSFGIGRSWPPSSEIQYMTVSPDCFDSLYSSSGCAIMLSIHLRIGGTGWGISTNRLFDCLDQRCWPPHLLPYFGSAQAHNFESCVIGLELLSLYSLPCEAKCWCPCSCPSLSSRFVRIVLLLLLDD